MKGIDVIVEQAGSRYQIAVVRVLGQIDTTTSHELERRLQFLLKDHQFEIVMDLSKVSYISSAGWGIFISEIRGIRESGGDLKLAGMIPEVAEVFELLEFHNILDSFRTVREAVEELEKTRGVVGGGRASSQRENPGENAGSVESLESENPVERRADGTPAGGAGQDATGAHSIDASEKESSLRHRMPRQDVATELMEPSGQEALETAEEADLEIVDPECPETVRQIRVEVVEEPSAVESNPIQPRVDTPAEPFEDQLIGVQPDLAYDEASEAQAARNRPSEAGEVGAGREVTDAATQSGDAAIQSRDAIAKEPANKEFQAMLLETVKEHPELGCLKLRAELLRRGYRKHINPLSLFMELKRLNLETKEKRRSYVDSKKT